MTDISKHPILQECYELCVAIEECGASEKLTEASMKASNLLESIDSLIANKSLKTDADDACPKCGGTGEVEYYHDAGDHFSMNAAPNSEWRKKACPECSHRTA